MNIVLQKSIRYSPSDEVYKNNLPKLDFRDIAQEESSTIVDEGGSIILSSSSPKVPLLALLMPPITGRCIKGPIRGFEVGVVSLTTNSSNSTLTKSHQLFHQSVAIANSNSWD